MLVLVAAIPVWLAPESLAQAVVEQPSTLASTSDSPPVPAPAVAPKHAVTGVQDSSAKGLARTDFTEHIKEFLEDQKQIWTSPAHVRLSDAPWLVPLGGIAAGLFVTDRQYSASLPQAPSTINHYKKISDYGVASLIGAGAGMYLLSFPSHRERWRETGFLAGEAALNSLVTVEALKYSLGRERPYEDGGSGAFFHGGTSFPSEHAAVAWSIAGVVAHEYPGPVPSLLAYGMASAVSFSRIRARQHFPSDVLIGSVLGYLTSQTVYRRHHDVELGGAEFESPRERVSDDKMRTPSFMGSPYVPLDSWVYPALERLAALGYVKTVSLGIRPWTRLECARLVGEAFEQHPDADTPVEVQRLYTALSEEFAYDSELMSGERNRTTQLESAYFRSIAISGKPLTDNEHFGQTLLNDYGRRYEQGLNVVSGASGWTTAGPFVIYTRGEYQYAPSAAAIPAAAAGFISSVDNLPPNPTLLPIATTSRFELLDAYVGMNLANWQLSFGRRSLWWGPSEGGTMLFTNNAPPLNNMFSIDRVSPIELPGILRLLGDIRFSAFIGQLSGQEFLTTSFTGPSHGATIGQYGKSLQPQPFLSGAKISFKFNENLEFSLAKTTIYGGPGNPLTPKTFFQSTFGTHVNGDVLGDGRTTADFSYRVPKLRDWLTFYGEALSEDEASPILFMRKSAFQGGLYFAKLPKISKLDLRLEGGTTVPYNGYWCASCFYSNGQYVNGYTNDEHLIGTWIGRGSEGELVRTSYWLSARQKIGIEVRHRKIATAYLPQGGTQNDVALSADILAGYGFRFTGNVQYEQWEIPILATNRQNNIAASFEFGFWPSAHAH